MKVLLTAPSLRAEFGGPRTKALGLAAGLRTLGTSVELVSCGGDGDATILPILMAFHGTPVPRRTEPLKRAVRDADVVHILGLRDPVGLLAARWANRFGKPIILEPVGMAFPRLRSMRLKKMFDTFFSSRILRQASVLMATSRVERDELVKLGVGPSRISLRPNGISVEEPSAPPDGALRQRLGIPIDAPLVLFLGRISAVKGLETLVRAIATLPDVWLLMAGPDTNDGTLSRIRQLAFKLRMGHRLVLIAEGVWGKDKAKTLAAADVLCLPSSYESFGNVILEALAVGIPVVASDRCGVLDFLNSRAVIQVPYGNEAKLSGALQEAFTDRGIKAAAERGSNQVRVEFDWEQIATKQLGIYEQARGKHSTKRFLIVNQYFPPDKSATAKVLADLVEVLGNRDHKVRVLAGAPSYGVTTGGFWRPLTRSFHGGVVVERLGSSRRDRKSIWGRICNYLSFVGMASIRGLSIRRPDAVLAASDPPFAIWPALIAARGRPVIYNVQDLHPDMAIASGMIAPGIATKLWDWIHISGLKKSEYIVAIGEAMAERLIAKGADPGRIHVIPNGAVPPASSPKLGVVATLRGSANFVALHAGNIGGAGAWTTLIEANRLLSPGSEIIFVGEGFNAPVLVEGGIRLHSFLPEEDVPSVMAAGDLQIVTLRRGMEGLVVPSKLYTILAHGRPVLAVVPEQSEVASIVRRWSCGFLANPDDPNDVAEKMKLGLSDREALKEMALQARAAGLAYRRDRLVGEFVDLMEEAANPRPKH